ncbi:MAG TPA: helix-turn-helix domain-containing protein, partial [Longimicrobiales bacterium]|nr:helix-turn-helix domain-containing protein [Longimicrobiales bacterium]
MLSTTRGRVLALLRRRPHTVNELADDLDLTANAIRLHLAALERDGLVEQEGVRRGAGKPAHLFHLTPDGESLFPKGYASLLVHLLGYVRTRDGKERLERLLREVGRDTGEKSRATSLDPRARVEAAAGVLTELGGLVEVEEAPDSYTIRGMSCPLAAVVSEVPEACALA